MHVFWLEIEKFCRAIIFDYFDMKRSNLDPCGSGFMAKTRTVDSDPGNQVMMSGELSESGTADILRHVYPGSEFCQSGSRVKKILTPGSRIRIKEFNHF
jgi:hypothetical protein